MKDDQRHASTPDRRSPPDGQPRRAYQAPKLTCFGAVQAVTLGGSPGIGESQNPGLFKGGGFG